MARVDHRARKTATAWAGRMVRGSLLLRFSLLSLVILALIAVGLGIVFQRQLEDDALMQQADEVAVVVDGVLNRHLTAADLRGETRPQQRSRWEELSQRLLNADRHLVRIKVWDQGGRVVYSNDPQQIGERFPIDSNLRTALQGRRAMDVSNLSEEENAGDRLGHSSLLETYIPIWSGRNVIGAYEAYSDLGALDARLNSTRRSIWGAVALGFLVLYASLFAIVRSASRRLIHQMRAIGALEVQAREAETLRQVDQLKDEFIGGVSHELRRPLASIKGYTASLLLPDTRWEPQVQHEFLEVIDEEADHLSDLIDNLLDLARLGSGSLPLSPEPVHLPVLAGQIVKRLRAHSSLPPHVYEIRFPDQFPFVEADHARMTQLVLNLLENAAKYSPPNTPIILTGREEDGFVAVSVSDLGPGLTDEQVEHVFDRFYRVDSGLTRATEGTGLGLAICRGVVEAHGGSISVSRGPDGGSIFTFYLPAIARVPSVHADMTERGA